MEALRSQAVENYRTASIVVLGDFNPAIFHPEWFRKEEILPSYEVDAALQSKDFVLTADVARVPFSSMHLEVLRDRWTLASERPDWVGDLGTIAASVFEKLSHTPVRQVGLNTHDHRAVRLPKTEKQVLAHWAPLGKLAEMIGTDSKVGVLVRAMWGDYRTALMMEASVKVKNGLYCLQNFERDLKGGTQELGGIIRLDWGKVLRHASEVLERIIEEPGHA